MAQRKLGPHLLSSEDLDAILDPAEASNSAQTDTDDGNQPTLEHLAHATHQPFATLKDLLRAEKR